MRQVAAVVLVLAVVGMNPGGMHAQVAGQAPQVPLQTADMAGPAFEVASLRIDHDSKSGGKPSPLGGNHWTVAQVNLRRLVALAFDLRPLDVVGVPDWSRFEFYVFAAKAEDGVRLTKETFALCLQRFLAERFKLLTHLETQPRKGYALVVGKNGPKMKAAQDVKVKMASLGIGSLHAPGIDMQAFAKVLEAAIVDQPVVDETGLSGTYEFTITFAREPTTAFPYTAPSTDSNLPSVFTALEEQLGLKLERRTVPVELVVIDHVEHPVLDR
jgi:uncharacterized protein (TIGR03435 family)